MGNAYAKVFKLLLAFWMIVILLYILNLVLQHFDTVQAVLQHLKVWLKKQ